MPIDRKPDGPIQVDIWSWSLDKVVPVDGSELLSRDEVDRARRFVKAIDRQRYSAGRGVLRKVLSDYLDIQPRAIRFAYNTWGKPELECEGDPPFHFNLSHSAGEAILAVSADAEIGVDIEEIKPLKEDVAGHFFSPAECAELRSFPEAQRVAAFYRCWTRKEAFVKAHGAGLSIPLNSFDVALDQNDHQQLLKRVAPDLGDLDTWRVLNLSAGDGYCAALAVFAQGRQIKVGYRNRLA